MLVKLQNNSESQNEWCLLEFQGEIVGDLVGNELGKIEIKEVVRLFFSDCLNKNRNCFTGRQSRNRHWPTLPGRVSG